MLERERLVARVDGARVVALVGGAGAGKSVLAEQLAGAGAALRVRVQDGDDAAAVASRLGSAARRQGLDVADGADLDGVLAAVARWPEAVQVVLDDVHRADGSAAEVVAAVVDLPGRHRVVLAGRARSWVGAAGAGALVLGDDELALTPTEVAALLGVDPTDATVAEVVAATGGWCAGVAAAAERLADDPRWSAAAEGASTALLGDLIDPGGAGLGAAAPIAARLPLLDDVTLGMLGPGHDVVADLPARRLGRWRVVLPAVARSIGAGAVVPDDVVVAVARRYLELGEVAAAFRLLAAEGGASATTEVLRHVPWTVLADLDVELVAGVVERSGGAAPDRAAVLLAAARAAELTDTQRRGRWLEEARRLDVDPVLARAIAAEHARYTIRGGDVAGGQAAARAVLAEAGDDELVTRARALSVDGMAETYRCTPEGFIAGARTYQEAAKLFARAGEVRWQADTLARLGYSNLFLAGRPVEGAEAMEAALAMLPVGDLTRAAWLTMQCDVLDFVGRVAEAEAAAREALEIGTRRGDPAAIGLAWWTRSWLASNRGDLPATRAALEEVERGMGAWMPPGQTVEFLTTSAEHLLLLGDVDGFHRYLDRARELAGSIERDEAIAIMQTAFDCAFGDAAAGIAGYAALEGGAAVTRIYRPRRLLFEAVGALRTGDLERAAALAQEARDDAVALGVPDLHERQHRLLLELLRPVLGAPDADLGPRPRLQLLGGFSLVVGGDVRTPPPGHPATLVKLLALGGPLPSEAAIDSLWPDADASTGRARLRNVLNRLKERSGPIVVRDGEILRLAPDVEVDVDAFESAAAAARAAADDARVGRARHALALHTGELLPGDRYDDWSTGPRARVQRRVLALADLVAADAESRGDLDEAARLLDLGMSLEPLDERRAARLADLLTRQGHVVAAAAVARRCADLLEELGVEPSPALAAHL